MIFYFSGTGNTKWAAEHISKATGEKLFSIAEEIDGYCQYTLDKDERLGFCFPIHGWQPPRIVRDFISKMTINGYTSNYIFAVCTCGDTVGDAIGILGKDLSNKGISLQGSFSLIMPESYVCLPFMYTDTKEKEKAKITKAFDELKEICNDVINRNCDIQRLHKGPTPWIYSYVIGNYFNKRMITDKPFNVDKNLCIGCGLCETVCPTGNITFENNRLIWRHDNSCTCCLACYHHCPQHAINYGKITRKRGQYYFKGIPQE